MKRTVSLLSVALIVVTTTVAVATPADWHSGRHPQPLGDATAAAVGRSEACVRCGDGRTGWDAVAGLTRIVGRALDAATPDCGSEEAGSAKRLTLAAVECVLRTGWLVAKGVPLPRAAAGVAAGALIRQQSDADTNGAVAGGADGGTTAAADSERTP